MDIAGKERHVITVAIVQRLAVDRFAHQTPSDAMAQMSASSVILKALAGTDFHAHGDALQAHAIHRLLARLQIADGLQANLWKKEQP